MVLAMSYLAITSREASLTRRKSGEVVRDLIYANRLCLVVNGILLEHSQAHPKQRELVFAVL